MAYTKQTWTDGVSVVNAARMDYIEVGVDDAHTLVEDSDLAAIAALTTTSYGRAFLALADQAALIALLPAYQASDSDLTSIAALTTTSYGRALLVLADQAALMTALAAASETVQGKVELATTAEATTGSDTARAVTPAGLLAALTVANLPDRVGLTIIETATGVWSGDATARSAGVNPIIFVGVDDPADGTNGIDTVANINAGDVWLDT